MAQVSSSSGEQRPGDFGSHGGGGSSGKIPGRPGWATGSEAGASPGDSQWLGQPGLLSLPIGFIVIGKEVPLEMGPQA